MPASDATFRPPPRLAITFEPAQRRRASDLANELACPLAMSGDDGAEFLLHVDGDGLALRRRGDRLGVRLQRAEIERRLRQGRKLALAKAVGIRPGLHVLDGMAGFGLDGMTLAALGASVVMLERHPVVFAMLQDALSRCRELVTANGGAAAARHDDVSGTLADATVRYDVVYLDPMFPAERRTALPNKRLQLLAALLHSEPLSALPAPDLADALACACERVVVKRGRSDPPLTVETPAHGARGPAWQIVSRSVRFDVYRGEARR